MSESSPLAASATEILKATLAEFKVDTCAVGIRTADDPMAAVKIDVIRVSLAPLLPSTLHVGGAMYDVKTGRLEPVLA